MMLVGLVRLSSGHCLVSGILDGNSALSRLLKQSYLLMMWWHFWHLCWLPPQIRHLSLSRLLSQLEIWIEPSEDGFVRFSPLESKVLQRSRKVTHSLAAQSEGLSSAACGCGFLLSCAFKLLQPRCFLLGGGICFASKKEQQHYHWQTHFVQPQQPSRPIRARFCWEL